mmetsp:Transcript_69128/g.112230  ORF Transcript_69128/g.112230 Transcript_69128/m.112230 type:complete len:85 (+) Transcript_69128:3-257(+)
MFAVIREVQSLYTSFEDQHATGPSCIPTPRNTHCYKDPLPGDDSLYGAYVADSPTISSQPPVGGTYVYWEHNSCSLDIGNGTCY